METPVYQDEDGNLYADDESGRIGDGIRRFRGRGISRRMGRLEARQGRMDRRAGYEGEDFNFNPSQDLRSVAASKGLINENQINGLGYVEVAANTSASLSDSLNRAMWIKGFVLDSDSPSAILVDGLFVAGLPMHIGNKGTPLSTFSGAATRFGIQFGAKLVSVGQTVQVDITNADTGSQHLVSGGVICDEMNPQLVQHYMEQTMLHALTSY